LLHDTIASELVNQIIPYRQQNALSALACVAFIAFQHSVPHMINDWHICVVHLLLLLCQNCSWVTVHLTNKRA